MGGERCLTTSKGRACGLRVDEVAGLTIVTLALMEMCLQLLGLQDPIALVIIAIGCVSYSAHRLLQVRRFGAIAARAGDLHSVMAATPFLLLPVVHRMNPASPLWHASMPPATRYVGMILALLVAVLRTRSTVARQEKATNWSPARGLSSKSSAVLMVSLLLIVPSAAVGLLMLCGLVAGLLDRPKAAAVLRG